MSKSTRAISSTRGTISTVRVLDATRWYMVTAGAPWNPLKFDSNGVRETYAKMFLTLWNVYKFHVDYAALDGFDPLASVRRLLSSRQWIGPLDPLSTDTPLRKATTRVLSTGNTTRPAVTSRTSLSTTCPTGTSVAADAVCGTRLKAETNSLASTRFTKCSPPCANSSPRSPPSWLMTIHRNLSTEVPSTKPTGPLAFPGSIDGSNRRRLGCEAAAKATATPPASRPRVGSDHDASIQGTR